MKTCEAVVSLPMNHMRSCGKKAEFEVYDPPILLCSDCMHSCMEDASPEDQATLKRIDE